MKLCSRCKQQKPLLDFSPNTRAKDGLKSACKICLTTKSKEYYYANREACIQKAKTWKRGKQAYINESARLWRSSPTGSISELLGQAKKRAIVKNLPFTLTPEDVEIPETCPVFGKPLNRKSGKGPSAWSPSLDKIIPANGYTPRNVMVMSHKANVMKNDATPEELLMFADWVYKTFGLLRRKDP